jgi:hypothetical protein
MDGYQFRPRPPLLFIVRSALLYFEREIKNFLTIKFVALYYGHTLKTIRRNGVCQGPENYVLYREDPWQTHSGP